jgi:hypothetical protein
VEYSIAVEGHKHVCHHLNGILGPKKQTHLFSKETAFQGDSFPRRQLSKETAFQGDSFPRRQLSKENNA